MMTLGIRMRTEFQNPTRTPPQFSPVQADDQALIQDAMLGDAGSVKMEKVRTSSEVLNEVAITTSSGIEKNRQIHDEQRIKPDAADTRMPARRRHRFFRASSKYRYGATIASTDPSITVAAADAWPIFARSNSKSTTNLPGRSEENPGPPLVIATTRS